MKNKLLLLVSILLPLISSCNIKPTVEPTIEPTIEPTVEPTPDPEPFTITYDSNGGMGVMQDQTVSSETFNLMENEFYKPGFNFIGWSLQPNGIVDYVDCEEWVGCAGYKIEGRLAGLVRKIVGSYSGVVGLPLFETLNLLNAEGIK